MTAEPPAGSVVRTSRTGALWRGRPDGYWETRDNPTGPAAIPATQAYLWPVLESGRFGDVELLVPLALTGDTPAGDVEVLDQLAANIVNPVGTMMIQLAQAAAAGVQAVLREANRRGRVSAARQILAAAEAHPEAERVAAEAPPGPPPVDLRMPTRRPEPNPGGSGG